MDCKVLLHRAEFSATTLVSGGLDLAGYWFEHFPGQDMIKRRIGRMTLTPECTLALRDFLNKVFPPSVDEVGQRPAAETAAEVTPQQTTPVLKKAAVSVS